MSQEPSLRKLSEQLNAKQAAIDILKKDLIDADSTISVLRGLLRRVEWCEIDYEYATKECPICKREKKHGHADDCGLAKELGG